MSHSLRRILAAYAHPPTSTPESTMPTTAVPAPRRESDATTRLHVDGSHRRDRWTYRTDAEGWVLEGLPSLDWRGRPAGVSRETIDACWPIRAADLRRAVNPDEAAADRVACRYRSVR